MPSMTSAPTREIIVHMDASERHLLIGTMDCLLSLRRIKAPIAHISTQIQELPMKVKK